MTDNNYIDLIRSRLKPKRFVHSLNVAAKAKALAEIFNEDPNKAYICGILHDVCKNNTDDSLLQIFDEFGIMLDDIQKNEKKLWHSIAGAEYAKHYLKIDDNEILNAIRYHTTSRENATNFEKIIYLADIISDERDFEGVDKLRQSVNEGLDFAYLQALQISIIKLVNKNRLLHSDTLDAYNQALMSGRVE